MRVIGAQAADAPGAEAEAAPTGPAPAASATAPGDLALALRTIPQIPHANTDSPYALGLPLTHLASDSITDQVELRAHRDGVNLIWTGSVQVQQDLAPSYSGVLDEAVLDRDWAGLRWSIGKKVLSWDVGFGFRPLDVVQQENRRALLVYALEGIPGVSAEAYGADSAWTFVLANPGRGRRRPTARRCFRGRALLPARRRHRQLCRGAPEPARRRAGRGFLLLGGQ
jgi:hypothetical protein